jgi:hypothetical protein
MINSPAVAGALVGEGAVSGVGRPVAVGAGGVFVEPVGAVAVHPVSNSDSKRIEVGIGRACIWVIYVLVRRDHTLRVIPLYPLHALGFSA